MAWEPLRDLVRRASDIARPVRLAEVVDTAGWAATGPSFVTVRVAGALRRAVYRDGPEPAVGSALQVVLMGAEASAPYLALPLPQPSGQCGQFYVSGQSLTDGTWAVLRCDPGVGAVWQHRSDHPLGDSGYPRRPLMRASDNGETLANSSGVHATPNRLFTWGTDLDHGNPGELFYSDDNAATWAGTGQAVSQLGNADYDGILFATDGASIVSSTDGASWSDAGTPPGGTIMDVWAVKSVGGNTLFAYTTIGLYRSLSFAGTLFGGWEGPWLPAAGAVGYVHDDPEQFSFDGDDVYVRTSGIPGTGDFVLNLTGRYATGAGHFFAATYEEYEHPGGLLVPIAGWALASPGSGFDDYCQIYGLDDSTIGGRHTRYMGRPDGSSDTYTVLDDRQATDLGAYYLPSPDGLSH